MNICADIHYKTLITAEKDLPSAIHDLLNKIPASWTPVRIVFFVDATADDGYFKAKRIIEDLCRARFGTSMPACAVVAQAPLEGTLQAEVHYFTGEAAKAVHYKNMPDGRPYATFETDGYKYLFTGALQAPNADMPVAEQAEEAFGKLKETLQREGMEMHQIVRQWNYICQITKIDPIHGQHYQQLNNSRSRHYGRAGWKNGYPAATGIGTACGSVILDADAMASGADGPRTQPIDNKLQIAAHEYSDSVLVRLKEGVTTPKFERARMLEHKGERLIYVSGTASIRGEQTLGVGDVEAQCRCTIENIRQLTHCAPLRLCRIYLKHGADYASIKPLIEGEYAGAEHIYIVADVCRDNLLIEIEGVS